MTKIPQQLHNPSFRFVKIRKGEKAPFEINWSTENNYKYDDESFQRHLSNGNYGVVCGYGNLVVIDCDDDRVSDAVKETLPKTFTVKTGRGGLHFYYICKDFDKPIRLKESVLGDLGDVQFTGKQVVGPGSIHPNGNTYEVIENADIAEVSASQIRFALKDFLQSNVLQSLEDEKEISRRYNISVSITDVVPLSNLKRRGNEYQGPHPIHGSTNFERGGPGNFTINVDKNVWHCFRHDTGGGPLSWIAVQEGLISCSEAVPGALRGEKFKELLKIAEEKYNIKIEKPESDFLKNRKIDTSLVADTIMEKYVFKTFKDTEELLFYKDGVYLPYGEALVKEEIENLIPRHASIHIKNEVISHIKSRTYIEREDFDKDKEKIVVKNGILNLKTMQLSNFDPSMLTMTKIPVAYDPTAKCPKILKFLHDVLDEKDIPVIQELMGYCLWRDYPISRAFMFLGEGSNGKSTLINLIAEFIGKENVSNVALQDFDRNRFATAKLYGKLVNLYADIPQNALYKTGKFKMLTGRDIIFADEKFKGGFQFKNFAKLIFSANKLPELKDSESSDAFFRRWIIINFPNVFTDNADPDILEKITTEEELSGLLNWSLEGLERLLKNKAFSRKETVDEIRQDYEKKSNSLKAFIEDCCEQDSVSVITKDRFYREYSNYCRINSLPVKSKIVVGRELQEIIPVEETTKLVNNRQQRAWRGVKIVESMTYITDHFYSNNNNNNNNNNNKSKFNLLYLLCKLYPYKETKSYFELEQEAKKMNISPTLFNKVHCRLKELGMIFEPRPDEFKRVIDTTEEE